MDKVQQKIINLCSNLFGETKAEIKKNNKSVDKLIEIFEEIKTDGAYAQQVYAGLLDYDDDKVKFEAAICCLKLKVCVREAKRVLKQISQYNPNPAIRFSAEMVLENTKGG